MRPAVKPLRAALLALLLATSAVAAEETTAPADATASALNATVAPPPAPTPAGASAALPVEPAARVERLRLSFAPIRLADEPTPPADDSPVIVLPKFEVRDDRIELSNRDITASKELLAQAKLRYLSQAYQATLGQLSAALGIVANLPSILGGWRPNDAEASALFAEDERLRRQRESEDLVDLLETADPATARELRRSVSDTFRHQAPLGARRHE
jgi:hypothetical protein